jgi:hypothetical protein
MPVSQASDPNYRRIELPLVRRKDKVPIGTLTIIRTNVWQFYDREGRRNAVPKRQETLIFTIQNPKGEEISFNQLAASDLVDLPAESHP